MPPLIKMGVRKYINNQSDHFLNPVANYTEFLCFKKRKLQPEVCNHGANNDYPFDFKTFNEVSFAKSRGVQQNRQTYRIINL